MTPPLSVGLAAVVYTAIEATARLAGLSPLPNWVVGLTWLGFGLGALLLFVLNVPGEREPPERPRQAPPRRAVRRRV